MDKMYVALEDLWPYIQKEYERVEVNKDLKGQQWCNWFLQLICAADHKKVEVPDVSLRTN